MPTQTVYTSTPQSVLETDHDLSFRFLNEDGSDSDWSAFTPSSSHSASRVNSGFPSSPIYPSTTTRYEHLKPFPCISPLETVLPDYEANISMEGFQQDLASSSKQITNLLECQQNANKCR